MYGIVGYVFALSTDLRFDRDSAAAEAPELELVSLYDSFFLYVIYLYLYFALRFAQLSFFLSFFLLAVLVTLLSLT